MLDSLSSNVILAKARAIYGKRLKPENYNELLRMKSVNDVAAYLKNNTYYSSYFKGINESGIHRGQLELLLKRSLFMKYSSLLNYIFSKHSSFYNFLTVDFEIEIILRCISLLNSNSADEIIDILPMFFNKYATFDIMGLSKVKSIQQLLDILNQTPYASIIKKYVSKDFTVDYSSCEIALKTYYYKNLLDKIDKNFKGKTKRELLGIVRVEIDVLNLSKIFRLKFYFNLPNERIKSRLLPFHYKYSDKMLDKMLEANSPEELIKFASLNSFNSKMNNVEYNYVEDYTKRLRFILNKKLLRFSNNSAIAFFSFMALTRIEIENLTIIIEGTRYNLPSQEIKKLLILE